MPVNLRRTCRSLAREKLKLYGLPQAEFTAARNARAKELRKDDPELAATVAALPKATAAAAALNELVREDPSEARALIQSGERLREAQEAAVAGSAAQTWRRRSRSTALARPHATRPAPAQAERSNAGQGREDTPRGLGRPGSAALLERGTLHEDLTAAGFGLDPGIVPAGERANPPRARRRPRGTSDGRRPANACRRPGRR